MFSFQLLFYGYSLLVLLPLDRLKEDGPEQYVPEAARDGERPLDSRSNWPVSEQDSDPLWRSHAERQRQLPDFNTCLLYKTHAQR